MKKLLALLLCLVMILSLFAGCGAEGDSDDDDEKERPKVTTSAQKDTDPSSEPTDPSAEATEPSGETEQPTENTEKPDVDRPAGVTAVGDVLFEKDGIKLTYQGMEDTYYGQEIKYDLENDTDEAISLELDVLVVNGMSVPAFSYASAESHESISDVVRIDNEDLELLGIETMVSVELHNVIIRREEDYSVMHQFSCNLVLDDSGELTQDADRSGVVLLDSDDLLIIAQGMSNAYGSKMLKLLVVNDSAQDFRLNVENLSVNGYTCNMDSDNFTVAGTVGICNVYIYEEEMQEQGITEIQQITFDAVTKFDLNNQQTYPGLVLDSIEGDVSVAPSEDTIEDGAMGATLDSVVIFDQDGIRVTVVGLEGGTEEPALKMLLENDSDANVYFTMDGMIVNGMYLDCYESIHAAAGKKANGSIEITLKYLERADIETIATISFVDPCVIDSDSYETLYTLEADLVTSVGADYEQAVDLSGQELVSQDGVRILFKGLEKEESVNYLILLVENAADFDLTVDLVSLTINGVQMDAFAYKTVSAGTYRYLELDVWDYALEEENISQIQEASIELELMNVDTYEKLVTTGVLTLDLDV